MDDHIAQIRKLVQQGRLDAALEVLLEFSQAKPFYTTASQLMGRYHSLQSDIADGVISPVDAEISRNRIQKALIELIERLENRSATASSLNCMTYPLPFKAEVFVGRETELKKIREALTSPDDNMLLLVNGNGGVGKTTLASRYFYEYGPQYRQVAWVLSEKNIAQAVLQLAPATHVVFEDQMPAQERLEKLIQVLVGLEGPNLLVIDNANEPTELDKQYPVLCKLANFHILLTTRVRDFQYASTLTVAGLPKEEALALFKKYYPKLKTEEKDLVEAIYEAVGANTLVLELLAKNLQVLNRLRQKYSLKELLADIQGKGFLHLSQSKTVRTSYGSLKAAKPEEIVSAMYELGELAEAERSLLSVFAVLPAENIEFEVLETLLPSREDVEDAAMGLFQKGWLEFNEEIASFKCSPVVQGIVREESSLLETYSKGIVDFLIYKLEMKPGSGHLLRSRYEESDLYVKYGMSVLGIFPRLDFEKCKLCLFIGIYLKNIGNINTSRNFIKRYLREIQMLSGLEVSEFDREYSVLLAYNYLGEIEFSLNNFKKALTNYLKYNEIAKKLSITYFENPAILWVLAISFEKIGNTFMQLNKSKEALEYFEKEHEIMENLVKSNPDRSDFKNSLALAYQDCGEANLSLKNYSDAKGHFESYHLLIKSLVKEEPNNDEFKCNLGWSHKLLGIIHSHFNEKNKSKFHFEKMNEIFGQLVKKHPKHVDFKRAFAESYHETASLFEYFGNKTEKINSLLKAEEIYLGLCKVSPESDEYAQKLKIVQNKLR